tara:strand:- start:2 stop:760 length:759 start_codon:yes stop_codon:yes gene_type:complete
MAPEANAFEDFFVDQIERLNTQLVQLYTQINRQEQEVSPSYLSLLNCNVITNVFRTIQDTKPEGIYYNPVVPPGEPSSNIANYIGNFQPTITVEFSEPGPPLILNYNIWPAFTGAETDNVVQMTVEKSATFWGVDLSDGGIYNMTAQQWWTNLGAAWSKAGRILENDLMHAMRNARSGNQAMVDFIPKPGIFLSVPVNSTSALTTPGGTGEGMFPVEDPGLIPAEMLEGAPPLDGPGGGDFEGHYHEEAMMG